MGSPTYNHTVHAIHRKSHPLLLSAKLQSPVSHIPCAYRVENTGIAKITYMKMASLPRKRPMWAGVSRLYSSTEMQGSTIHV